MDQQTVKIRGEVNLAKFVSQLIREGVTWVCNTEDDSIYIIKFNGGY